jgi:predicted glycogen debranching enzyme
MTLAAGERVTIAADGTIAVGAEALRDVDHALSLEWLETNGRGGYASTSVVDCHTRKYHGLLVPALETPPGRFVLLSRLDATVRLDGEQTDLGCNQFPGALHPTGLAHAESFHLGLAPTITWRLGESTVQRTLMMVDGEDRVILRYLLTGSMPAELALVPHLAFRNSHALTARNDGLNPAMTATADGWRCTPYDGLPPLHIDASAPLHGQPDPHWVEAVEYRAEAARGFDHHEDLFVPGRLLAALDPHGPLYVSCGTAPPSAPIQALWQDELDRRQARRATITAGGEGLPLLRQRADQFLIVNSRGEHSVVAGYPWFVEWGRDTMIALPGLTVCNGRPQAALEVLEAYARHERDGRIPNYLATGDGEHAYNSIDAALWYTRAAQLYAERTGQAAALADRVMPCVGRILGAYADGRVAEAELTDGLICAGTPDTQLTWMDAQAHGRPVTPRHGMAVETNALWYNALTWYLAWCGAHDVAPDSRLPALQQRAAERFVAVFTIPGSDHLADSVNANGQDRSVRPNQLYAAALPHSPLSLAARRGVVAAAERLLLTPHGLRTLAPADPAYRGRYEGGSDERDSAYHQGTVWPWLVGPFVDAALRSAEDVPATAERLLAVLSPLWTSHLCEAGLGCISEVLDGDPPQRPAGCIHQAWSVSEVLRAHAALTAARP